MINDMLREETMGGDSTNNKNTFKASIKMFLFLDLSYLMLPMIYGWVDGYGPNVNLNQNIFLRVFKLLNTKYCLEMSKYEN